MSLLENIKSIYVRVLPFQYLKENFLYKLINYSKKTQIAFGLKLSDYKQKYFNQFNIDIDKYISVLDKDNNKGYYPSGYTINSLKNNLEKDMKLFNLNIEAFQNYAINAKKQYIEEKKINDKNKFSLDDILIDIFSPFIDLFSKDNYYQKLFTIPIPIKFIKEKNLTKEYFDFFNNVNKSNFIYNSFLSVINDFNDAYNIKNFGINFMKIKRMGIKILSEDRLNFNDNFKENDLFNIFNLNNIENNLRDLVIDAKLNIKTDIFETINNFKFLNYLSIKYINFDEVFTVKSKSLKSLKITNCENISISQECANILKSLVLIETIITSKYKLRLPEVEIFKNKIISYSLIKETIDLNSMPKLKNLFIDIDINLEHLNNFNKLPLQKLTLYSFNKGMNFNYIIEALEKVLELKNLKKFRFALMNICMEKLFILGNNNTIEKLKLIGVDADENFRVFYNYQNKFPKATYLDIQCFGIKKEGCLEIKENKSLKINTIRINVKGENGIYIQSYETLTDVELRFFKYKHNENGFALFNDEFHYKFDSLMNLNLSFISEVEIKIVNNIFKNLEKIPNLKKFSLHFVCKDVDKRCYEEYIKILLSLKLKSIELKKGKSKQAKTVKDSDIPKKSEESEELEESEESEETEESEDHNLYYSESELKIFNKDFSLMKYYKILINKFN